MNRLLKVNKLALLGVLIYITTFFSTTFFNYNLLRYVLVAILAVALAVRLNSRILRKNLGLNVAVLLFIIISLWISFGAQHTTERNPFYSNIIFAIVLAELVLYLEIAEDKNMLDSCCKAWYWCALVVMILTDILAIVQGEVDETYLIGTKFSVIYQHLFVIVLFMQQNADRVLRKNSRSNYSVRLRLFLLLMITVVMAICVDCMTGVIGTISIFILAIFIGRFRRLFTSPVFFGLMVLLGFSVIWTIGLVLLNSGVQNFITGFLNRDLTLTGRTAIFAGLAQLMQGHWATGYGYGTSYEICMNNLGYADTQNALMEWVLQVGLIGAASLVSIFVICMCKSHKVVLRTDKLFNTWIWPMALVYTYILLGTIEITYNMQFVGALMLVYCMGMNAQRQEEHIVLNSRRF